MEILTGLIEQIFLGATGLVQVLLVCAGALVFLYFWLTK